MKNKIIVFIILVIALAFAHGKTEEIGEEHGIKPPEIISVIWAIHSWTHWLVWIGFVYTCYYFRFFIGYNVGHPYHCATPEKNGEYFEEDTIKQWHGIFVWIMFIWAAIHISELIGEQLGYAHPPTYSLGEFIPGEEVWEFIYIVTTILILSSCHYIRFLSGSGTKCFSCLAFGKQRQKVFTLQSLLNNYHGHFFWIAIIAGILVLLSGGHL